MIKKYFLLFIFALTFTACENSEPKAVGQLISDRVELVAETSEPIVSIFALEGDSITVGQGIVEQDSTRLDILILEAQASIAVIEARLTEQLNGPRQVTIAIVQASLIEAEVERDFRSQELQRLQKLLEQNFTSKETVDLARNRFDAANARLNSMRAQLQEIEAGTREEQLEQTRQNLAQAKAALAKLIFDKQRSTIISPVPATLDSLPFEIGERPRVGDVVAVLLTGSQPHARVYIPEQFRTTIQPGDSVSVIIDSLPEPLTGTVRRIASEASFTPYFALTENDRGRLTFVAEISLQDRPQRLPEGMPVEMIINLPASQ